MVLCRISPTDSSEEAQVKDFFGKHVPTFSHPVSIGDSVGVAMEFAAMEGRPETLQDSFEQAEDDRKFQPFCARLGKALTLLCDKLYRNTRRQTWVAPYRAFGLHTDEQLQWLHDNVNEITGRVKEDALPAEAAVSPQMIEGMIKLIAANDDGVESDVCLTHGDLNFQNIICDQADNIWFIDWTHSGEYPLEIDFAKLENDVKFVMSKQFEMEDLPRLKRFEEYLLSQRMPVETDSLPENLRFVKWDFRFRRILETVARIRQSCFGVKTTDDWLVYQVALLKYAMHTLSFDHQQGRGECDLPQLMHALYSVEALAFNLVNDEFQLRIRGERPDTYPPRQRISIDLAPWDTECSDYQPPYYVDSTVLGNDRTQHPDGWADPEDFSLILSADGGATGTHRDTQGRRLNPMGRTGIAGRGLLGRWGANEGVAAVVIRTGAEGLNFDVLIGKKTRDRHLSLPRGFLILEEDAVLGIKRILKTETGWNPLVDPLQTLSSGYFYEPRQTDHAWIKMTAFLFFQDFHSAPDRLQPGDEFEEVAWFPVTAETVNRMPPNQARFVRESAEWLQTHGDLETGKAHDLLKSTG